MLSIKDCSGRGFLATVYVMLELAKRRIISIHTPSFAFDLLCDNGVRLEVKSATPKSSQKKYKDKIYVSSRKNWQWQNRKHTYEWISGVERRKVNLVEAAKRSCDFYVLVGFDENLENPNYFVIPKEVCEELGSFLCLPIDGKLYGRKSRMKKLWEYKDRWDLIKGG